MIDKDLLILYGAKLVHFDKGEVLFQQGDHARYYHQILTGAVKMNNFNDGGKEFVQGFFNASEGFGEPALFLGEGYPANAVAICACHVYQLPKEKFLQIMAAYPHIHLEMTVTLARRLYYKTIMASEISNQEPEHRVIMLIHYFKTKVDKVAASDRYKVEITRQQIADLTGLRVETVIRAIKSLERKGRLTIENRKVYL